MKPRKNPNDTLLDDIRNHPLKKQSTQTYNESMEYRRDKEELFKMVNKDGQVNEKLRKELDMMMLRSEQERLKKKIQAWELKQEKKNEKMEILRKLHAEKANINPFYELLLRIISRFKSCFTPDAPQKKKEKIDENYRLV